eukprot:COSAG02_NODE_56012_length_287_cov_1.351064_1_plen_32_part_01
MQSIVWTLSALHVRMYAVNCMDAVQNRVFEAS